MTKDNLELGWKKLALNWRRVLVGKNLGKASALILIFGSVFCSLMISRQALAADLSAFDAGYIISDFQMGNYNSMNETEIYNFLKSKGKCNDTNLGKTWNNIDSLSEASPITWHVKDGHFVCMADEDFSGETAAHIIWQAAQDYRINPQVLIVLLQKEQGLITDSYPNSIQYRSATGYGCPDTAACSEKYYGFKNQIRNAAALFRSVLDGGWSNYPVGERYVKYNPNDACGGSVVNIRNRATSALYRYTPYQPNAGALAAGYGTAECGAYGNRNFYLYFEDWFGGVTREVPEVTSINSVDIEEGTYRILNYEGDKAVTIAEKSRQSGANVLLEKNSYNDESERWQFTRVDNYYIIKNLMTGQVLDVANNEISNLANVWQYEEDDSCTQRWRFARNKDGSYVIHNACRLGYVLDLQDGKTNLQIYEVLNNGNQKWLLERVDTKDFSGTYEILNKGNNKAITIEASAYLDTANIVAAKQNEMEVQRWTIKRIDDYYVIFNKETGKVFDVANGIYENKTNLWQYEENDSCAQRWRFYQHGDVVSIYNACHPNLVVDLQDGLVNAQVYADVGGVNQEWFLKPVANSGSSDAIDYSGSYRIIHQKSGKVLAVFNNATKNGAKLVASVVEDSSMQEWQIRKNGDYYTIMNLGSGKFLDVANAAFNNNTILWQHDENLSCAQRWSFMKNSDDTVMIRNTCYRNFAVDLEGGNTNLQIYEALNNSNQRFRLEEIETNDFSGSYQILNGGNNKAITVSDGSRVDGGNIVVAVQDNSDFQKWVVQKVDNYYTITNLATRKVLDVANGIFENNRNLWQFEENRSCAQRWRFAHNKNNSVFIYNACYSSMVLDLQDGIRNVQIYSRLGGPNQEWVLSSSSSNVAETNTRKERVASSYVGSYRIAMANNENKVLSVAEIAKRDGVNVEFAPQNDSDAQIWQIQAVEDYFIIENQSTGKVLDIQNGIYNNNTNVWQYGVNYSCAQRWQFADNGDGTVSIYNACYPNLVLDLEEGKFNLQIYTKIDRGVNQTFKLIAT